MNSAPRGLRQRPRAFGRIAAIGCLLLTICGLAAVSFHHHAAGADESRCNICALAHSASVVPGQEPRLEAPALVSRETFSAISLRPLEFAQHLLPSRAPPVA